MQHRLKLFVIFYTLLHVSTFSISAPAPEIEPFAVALLSKLTGKNCSWFNIIKNSKYNDKVIIESEHVLRNIYKLTIPPKALSDRPIKLHCKRSSSRTGDPKYPSDIVTNANGFQEFTYTANGHDILVYNYLTEGKSNLHDDFKTLPKIKCSEEENKIEFEIYGNKDMTIISNSPLICCNNPEINCGDEGGCEYQSINPEKS